MSFNGEFFDPKAYFGEEMYVDDISEIERVFVVGFTVPSLKNMKDDL